jgi:hypothetical protein
MSARIGGRPSSYKASIASAICTQLREGEYLKSICQQEGMPSLNTVYRWARRYSGLVVLWGMSQRIAAQMALRQASRQRLSPSRGHEFTCTHRTGGFSKSGLTGRSPGIMAPPAKAR